MADAARKNIANFREGFAFGGHPTPVFLRKSAEMTDGKEVERNFARPANAQSVQREDLAGDNSTKWGASGTKTLFEWSAEGTTAGKRALLGGSQRRVAGNVNDVNINYYVVLDSNGQKVFERPIHSNAAAQTRTAHRVGELRA